MDQGATAARRANGRAGKIAGRAIDSNRVRYAGNRNNQSRVMLRAAQKAICSRPCCLANVRASPDTTAAV